MTDIFPIRVVCCNPLLFMVYFYCSCYRSINHSVDLNVDKTFFFSPFDLSDPITKPSCQLAKIHILYHILSVSNLVRNRNVTKFNKQTFEICKHMILIEFSI